MKVTSEPINEVLTEWNEAVGRTILSVREETIPGQGDRLIFRFADGAAVLLIREADYGYYMADPIEVLSEEAQVYLGLVSEDEYRANELARQERLARALAEIAERERVRAELVERRFATASTFAAAQPDNDGIVRPKEVPSPTITGHKHEAH